MKMRWNVLLAVLAAAGAGTISSLAQTQIALTPGTITTVAGTGTAGDTGDGAAAMAATISTPYSLRTNPAGDYVIAEGGSNRIREVLASNGFIKTVAGNGVLGYSGDGTPATGAEINAARGLAIDALDNVYIADSGNNRVRVVYAGGATVAALIAAENPGTTAVVGNIYTIAGTGSATGGTASSLATAQGLNSPRGLWVDTNGNLYIAAYSGNKVYVVYVTGAATAALITTETNVAAPVMGNMYTLAGTGTGVDAGDAGLASAAGINTAADVAVDAANNLYVLEQAGNKVRKIDGTTGKISTWAGNGTAGFAGDGGIATSAEFNTPRGLAVDPAGNVYVADTLNNAIRKIDGQGNISTVAGLGGTANSGFSGDGGNATVAKLNQPYEAGVDGNGNLYFIDVNNQRVRKVNVSAGTFAFAATAVAASSASQIATISNTGASTLTLNTITVPAGYTQVASGGTDCAASGKVLPGASCLLDLVFSPTASGPDNATVSVASTAGTAALAVTGTGVVAATTSTLTATPTQATPGQSVKLSVTVTSSGGTPTGQVQFLDGATLLDTETLAAGAASFSTTTLNGGSNDITAVYQGTGGFTKSTSNDVSVLVQATGATKTTSTLGSTSVTPSLGQSVTITATVTSAGTPAPTGKITLTDNGLPLGSATLAASGASSATAQVSSATLVIGPHQILASYPGDANNLPSVAAAYTVTVTMTEAAAIPGIAATLAGTGTVGHAGDGGAATQATLTQPLAARFDPANNLFISDGSNFIRKVAAGTGIISTVAGTGAAGYTGDNGPAASAQINVARGLTTDSAGNIYLSDSGNNRVRMIYVGGATAAALVSLENPAISTPVVGNLYTVAGGGTGAAGTLASSQALNSPRGLTIDALGNLFIADLSANRVRVVYMAGSTVASLITLENPTVTAPVAGNMYVLAGTGVGGDSGDGGLASSATINAPSGVGVDPSGNVYLLEFTGSRLRAINASTGKISTLAGTGVTGFAGDGGPATAAQFNSPRNLWVDYAGGIYIADTLNGCVRKIDSTGTITTIAGIGGTLAFGGDGGVATAATFGQPYDVAFDSNGNFAIAELNSNRVRGVTAATSALSFPNTLIGTATTESLAVANIANAAVTPSAITVPTGFTRLTGSAGDCAVGTPIAPDTSCNVRLNFTAAQAGIFTGTLTVATNAANLPQGTITAQVAASAIFPNTVASATRLAVAPSLTATPTVSGSDVGDTVTFTATVTAPAGSPTPTGSVLFLAAGKPLGSGAVSAAGVATFSLSTLPLGTTTVSATYEGSSTYQPSTSPSVTATVYAGPGDFTLGAVNSLTSATVTAGSSALYSLTLTSTNGFEKPVTFTCSNLPANASCQAFPGTLTPLVGQAAVYGLAIATAAPNTAASGGHGALFRGTGSVALAVLLCLPLGLRRARRKLRRLGGMAILLLGALTFMMGCSGKPVTSSGPTTAPGTYTVTVTASAGTISHSMNVTLIVQ